MTQRILCLWIPSWPVQRRVMDDATLAGQAVAVHHAAARAGRQLLACSKPARRLGLNPGMPLTEASSLRRRRPAPLHLLAHDPEADLQRLELLAEHCERFSPLVGWQTTEDSFMSPASGPDCLLMDVTNIGRHFGGEQELMRRACESFGRRGVHVAAGLADTIGAAWAAAHYDRGGRGVDSSHRWILPPATSVESLAEMNPAALRINPNLVLTLQQLGVITVRQMITLPRQSLAARLGDEPAKRWDQAIGRANEILLAHRPPVEFFVERQFESPVRDRRSIATMIQSMTHELTQQLRKANRGAVEVTCRMDSLQGQTTQLRLGLFEPSKDPEHIWDLLKLQLESAQTENGVERIALKAPQVSSLRQTQRDLFGKMQDHEAAAHLVDRLRLRLGTEQVVQAQLRADPQPERAVAYVARLAVKQRGVDRTKPPATSSELHRPLALTEPEELNVFQWKNDLPKEFTWNGRLVEVLRHWGPERIETGWWRSKSVRRDYYRVELRTGERLWIFCQLNTKLWYLHGWYA